MQKPVFTKVGGCWPNYWSGRDLFSIRPTKRPATGHGSMDLLQPLEVSTLPLRDVAALTLYETACIQAGSPR
jgi:hypothetical protein